MRKTRRPQKNMQLEVLEDRFALDGTGFAGNVCPPDLDVSNLASLSGVVGEEVSFSLYNQGATATDLDGNDVSTGDTIRLVLDPNDNPAGATITEQGAFNWTPTSAGTFEFVVIAIDEGTPRLGDAEVFTIEVVEMSDAPTIDLNGGNDGTSFAAAFTEGDDPVAIVGTGATVDDDVEIVSVTAQITNLEDAGDEVLSVSAENTGVSAIFSASTGTLTLTGDVTPDVFQDVLRTLTYENTSASPTDGTRTIEIVATDDDSQTAMAEATVEVVGVNSAPLFDAIADQDAMAGEEFTLVVTASDPDGDSLAFNLDPEDAPAAAVIENNNDGTATIRWTPEAADAGDVLFRVIVTDDAASALSDQTSFTVTVAPPDTSPILDLNGAGDGTDATATFVEDGAPVAIASDLTVTDPDDADLANATITLVGAPDGANEQLGVDVSGTNIVQQFDTATRTLSLTGSDTVANWQQVLRSVTYTNTTDEPDLSDRVVTFVVSDGEDSSETVSALISITSVDDAPVLTLGGDAGGVDPIEIDLGDTVSFTASATDSDSDVNRLAYSLDLTNTGITSGEALPTITQPSVLEVTVFNTPVNATEPGPISNFDAYQVDFTAEPGDRLSLATMIVETNDWFVGTGQNGIELYDGDTPLASRSITTELFVLDAGTEIDQTFAQGDDQPVRQSGPNTGAADPDNTVRQVANQTAAQFISVDLQSNGGNSFTLLILNLSAVTPFAPGVVVVHNGSSPIYTEGVQDRGEGLEALAEDGDPSQLAASLAANSSDPGGVFNWTPTEAGSFPVTVVVEDSTGQSTFQTFTVNVTEPPAATPANDGSINDLVFSDLDEEDEDETDLLSNFTDVFIP